MDAPDDWELEEASPLTGFGDLHAGSIFLAAFCDGHITVVSNNIDVQTFKALTTIAGGELVDSP